MRIPENRELLSEISLLSLSFLIIPSVGDQPATASPGAHPVTPFLCLCLHPSYISSIDFVPLTSFTFCLRLALPMAAKFSVIHPTCSCLILGRLSS